MDGNPVAAESGADVKSGETVDIDGSRLYNVVASNSYSTRHLELMVYGNVEIYTFTFG